jgi:tetratricopeptide (TPR) repeat protein
MARALGPWFGVVYLALLFGGSLAILLINNRLSKRGASRAEQMGEKPQTSRRVVIMTALLLLLMFWLEFERRPINRRGGRAPDAHEWVTWVVLAFPVVVIPLLVAVVWVRWRRSVTFRSFKKAEAGDVEGAIVDLREEIAERGASVDRLNSLGVFLVSAQKYQEAYQALVEAERLGSRTSLLLSNQGIALRKLGRAEEARAVLAEACALEPKNVLAGCNHCFVLADLGKAEEASAELRRVEQVARTSRAFLPSVRRGWDQAIEECRTRLAVGSSHAGEAGPDP